MSLPVHEDEGPEGMPAGLTRVGTYDDAWIASDRGLVILAMRLPYWQWVRENEVQLFVQSERAGDVVRELTIYEEEQEGWNPAGFETDASESTDVFYGPYIFAMVLILAFILQNHYGLPYVRSGRIDVVAMLEGGEWWRAATALFLHGDLPHLIANLTFGVWYGAVVSSYFGSWLGWSAILLSGVLGNIVLAVYYHPEPHFGVGASTAIFGALGILVSAGFMEARRRRWLHGRRRWLPVVGGLVFLAWTGGFGDASVDSLAHVFGFLSGIALGLLMALYRWRDDAFI